MSGSPTQHQRTQHKCRRAAVSWSLLLVLVSKGFLLSEGRNPTLQTLVRVSGRKIDHLFQESKYYEVMVKKSAIVLVQLQTYSLPHTPPW